jgi:hypothetical protein
MKIYHDKYSVPVGDLLHCVQCGKIVRSAKGVIRVIYVVIVFNYPLTKSAPLPKYSEAVCRKCFSSVEGKGLRQNWVGSIKLYDTYSGQPYDTHGNIPALPHYEPPWKEDIE